MQVLKALTWGLVLTYVAGAQPVDPRHILKVNFRVQPPGAGVYLQAESFTFQDLVNRDIAIDRDKFPHGFTVYFGGVATKNENLNEIPQFHGYLPRKLVVSEVEYPPPPPESTSVENLPVTYYPGLNDSEPLQLKPAPGMGAALARFLYWWQTHPLALASVLTLAGIGLFFVIAVVVPRRKSWLEERAKVAKFNARLRSLDVANDLFLGRQFGQWATVKRLGQGGMAVVYKGVSIETMNEDEAVAVKVMNPELAQDQDYRNRFKREVQISRTLDHPNVVRMIDSGEQDGVFYLAMEYIQGETLRDLLPTKGLPLTEGIPMALGIVQGLIHAHNKGIVHRDLKPDNIMVTEGKLVKVMDLGLAKREESENVTRTGDTFGTPAYMAPEQITGGTLLPATDQYALGVMLFEMFTGRRPFEVADSLTLVMKHLQEPPPRIREYKSQLPDELEVMIDRMLLKDPTKRYKSLVDVQVELTKIQRKYCGT